MWAKVESAFFKRMSLSTFIRLVTKAYKFAVIRPIQRYNVANRSKKYLGPEAKYFMPAPRAVGALSKLQGAKPPQYPHLEAGSYKSIKERRLEALERIGLPTGEHLPKAFSETKEEDNLVIEGSNKLDVTKTITRIEPSKQLESGNQSENKELSVKTKRPLPTSVNLPLQDMRIIWQVDKTPPGRLNLNMLQEMMLNKLGDDKYWTPKAISERYQIKEEYAEDLIKHLKQIRIVISPRINKLLNYVGRNDELYNSSKHLVYHVDKRLRNEKDKQFDEMFLPTEEIDPDVKKILDVKEELVLNLDNNPMRNIGRITKKPEPLRIGPVNVAPEQNSNNQMLIPSKSSTKVIQESTRQLPSSNPTSIKTKDGKR